MTKPKRGAKAAYIRTQLAKGADPLTIIAGAKAAGFKISAQQVYNLRSKAGRVRRKKAARRGAPGRHREVAQRRQPVVAAQLLTADELTRDFVLALRRTVQADVLRLLEKALR